MILVTGATGNVGRHVVQGLRAAGEDVRPFSRATGGDLTDPGSVKRAMTGIDRVFLLWPGPGASGVEAAVGAITETARKVVYLSALGASAGFWAVPEREIERSGADFVFLRPGGFAANTLGWAAEIRERGEVRWPYGEAARSLIHERDLAEVAVKALTTDALDGQRPELTGPANVTQREQVRLIGEAVGRELRWVELGRAEAREQLVAMWGDAAFADSALDHWASLVGSGEPVTGEVERILGRPARTFREWAVDHAADFTEKSGVSSAR